MESLAFQCPQLVDARLGAQDFSVSSDVYDSPGDKLATPYFQLRFDSVPSTQDVARDELSQLPLLVMARSQTRGRGRSGADWVTADRALAASLSFHHDPDETRPLSLIAGLAAVTVIDGAGLKWPNDVMIGSAKVGGILVERGGGETVVGFGLNLWWPDAPLGTTAIHRADPGDAIYAEVGALWGAELLRLIDTPGWPVDRYREACVTLGSEITWEPDGSGRAVDVNDAGGLVVETSQGTRTINSGEVRHVRG